jgi:uncharacterized protein YegP (UPF0339 family)
MPFVIYEDNGGAFHWRLVDGMGAAVALSATAFRTRADAAQAAADVRGGQSTVVSAGNAAAR